MQLRHMRSCFAVSLFSYVALVSGLQPIYAQTANPAGLITPTPKVEESIPESQKSEKQRFAPEETQPPKIEINVPEPPTILELKAQHFKAEHIQVEDSVLLDEQTVRKLVAPYEGKEMTLDDLGRLVEKIND